MAGLAEKPYRWVTGAIAILCLFLAMPFGAFAAPGSSPATVSNQAIALGDGSFAVLASVYAEGTDGQVGTLASSGHEILADDNLVALPACTESSCPWVPAGTGTDGRFGPQTDCAEADGLCWVQIVSDETGACTVAPVQDRGPLFVRDNWWAPLEQRQYDVPQGIPAAEYAADGTDFGFGAGISDAGYDVKNVYDYAAGIDLAAGTWKALGLPVAAGISAVTVTMLWQAGVTHDQACSGAPAPAPNPVEPSSEPTQPAANPTQPASEPTQPSPEPTQPASAPTQPGAISGDATVIGGELNLRAAASVDGAVLGLLPDGATVTLTGRSVAGFLSISYQGTAGWASADFLDISGPAAAAGVRVKVIDGALNLRANSSTDAQVLQVLDDGAELTLTGDASGGYLAVTVDGTNGWAFASYLEAVNSAFAKTATVLDGALNLRAEANQSAEVLTVIPDGATVSLLGRTENGFSEISYNGADGWAASMYLSSEETGNVAPAGNGAPDSGDGARVAPSSGASEPVAPSAGGPDDAVTATVSGGDLNLRSGASTGDAVLTVIPDGATVTLLGETANGFANVQFDGAEGWAWASCLD
ncbi:MAG TPA: SH3 domain-containing protein [Thermomicrobiales bacterium]|nr:SH3 domain-containing protein [Thermomicrobiales bacterium]